MRLTMSVVVLTQAGGQRRHVTIEAPSGTPFSMVRADLAAALGGGDQVLSFAVDGQPVDDATLGRPPLLQGALLTAGAPGTAVPVRETSGVVEMRVAGGSGAGRVWSVGRGQHVIGRAASSSIRLDDPGISRAHAVIDVRSDGVRVRDLEPTNPSLLDDTPLSAPGAPLRDGQRLRIGSTTLVLGPSPVRSGRHDVSDGRVLVHRQPRLRDSRAPTTVAFPESPRRPEHGRMPLLTSLAPLVLSGVLALALSSPALLLFALMSPVLLLGQWWSDRRAGRSSHRRQLRQHAAELAVAREQLAEAALAYAVRLRHEHPDLAEVAAVATRRGTRLWERRPGDGDHLVVRVGTARQRAALDCVGASAEPAPDVDDLPAVLDLGRLGVTGVAGPRPHLLSLAGSIAVQVATWHTPRHVSLHILVSTVQRATDWEWVGHLPHVADLDMAPRVASGRDAVATLVSALVGLVEERRAAHVTPWAGTAATPADVVVVVDGAGDLRSVAGLADLFRDGPAVGVVFLCLDETLASLPAETRMTVEIDTTGASASMREDGRTLDRVVPDLPTTGWLERVSRALAPLVDATPEAGAASLPREVSFAALHRAAGVDPLTPEGISTSWSRSVGRPRAFLGQTPDGPLAIDLAVDGPHVLVGGTTGSGKSELLQALVAGLAVTNRPDELAFVLVDYKGGSAFSECARLPHTSGLVTDLDGHLTTRALTSLEAEMKRRERLLGEAGAKDLDEYRREARVCPGLPPLARLVIVVDEFKALADEYPDFVAGLVRIAALGRSLGLHLVLATQRPAGIVSADMRANIALRIALRVRDRTDSDDVIDSPTAATLDPRAPGRACLRTGDRGLVTVQTAYLGRPAASATAPAAPVRLVLHDGPFAQAAAHGGDLESPDSPTELAMLVESTRVTAARLGIRSAPPPWLPPLPDVVGLADVLVQQTGPSDPATAVPLGLADVPEEQRREVLWWRVGEDGHLGIAGGPRSGRSSALVAIALRVASTTHPSDVHVHVIQGTSGPCAALDRLACVGTVTTTTDPTTARRLVSRLLGAVDGSEHRPRHTVVLVDGWETVEERLASVDHGATVDDLHRLLRDGPAAGVQFVISGGRAVLSGRLPGVLDRRLVLQMPDPLDLTLAGIAPEPAGVTRPPGRAVDVQTGRQVQLALPGPDPSTASTMAAVDDVTHLSARDAASTSGANADGLPWRLVALPDRVGLADVSAPPDGADALVLGVGGDTATALPVDVSVHRRWLVAGTPRSGRSSALATLGEQLVANGRSVVAVCPRRSPLWVWAQTRACRVLAPGDGDVLVAARRRDPDLCILVDDVELVERTAVEEALLQTARLVDDTDGLVAVAADLARAGTAFRGLVPEIARDGCGLILSPSAPSDGDVLGVRLDDTGRHRAGRGFLVTDGQAHRFQVALADLTELPAVGCAVSARRTGSPLMTDRLLETFSKGLKVPASQLSDETSPSNTPAWDSLAAMEMVVLIEDTFDVRLKTSEIMRMRSIGLARTVLRGKGVEDI
ncbi:FtsK/SpoIIIE domain-containing protein [Terrabacter sp. GCM10028922]|uniref:FtsK/SpoIIIE domain-containing protein n=1 Tax=Terrabacter sp. GCM10028922 TaxID=3273428 RepID=UPI0036148117